LTPQTGTEPTGSLGAVDVATVSTEINSSTRKRKSTYQKWSAKDRYSIGKYASENGNACSLRKFKPN